MSWASMSIKVWVYICFTNLSSLYKCFSKLYCFFILPGRCRSLGGGRLILPCRSPRGRAGVFRRWTGKWSISISWAINYQWTKPNNITLICTVTICGTRSIHCFKNINNNSVSVVSHCCHQPVVVGPKLLSLLSPGARHPPPPAGARALARARPRAGPVNHAPRDRRRGRTREPGRGDFHSRSCFSIDGQIYIHIAVIRSVLMSVGWLVCRSVGQLLCLSIS